jgi:hypothetical protein
MPLERTNASVNSLLKKYFQINLKNHQKKYPLVLSMISNVLGADLFMLAIFYTDKGYESFQITNFEGLKIETEHMQINDIYQFLDNKAIFVEQFNQKLYYTLVDNYFEMKEKALILIEKITIEKCLKNECVNYMPNKI